MFIIRTDWNCRYYQSKINMVFVCKVFGLAGITRDDCTTFPWAELFLLKLALRFILTPHNPILWLCLKALRSSISTDRLCELNVSNFKSKMIWNKIFVYHKSQMLLKCKSLSHFFLQNFNQNFLWREQLFCLHQHNVKRSNVAKWKFDTSSTATTTSTTAAQSSIDGARCC